MQSGVHQNGKTLLSQKIMRPLSDRVRNLVRTLFDEVKRKTAQLGDFAMLVAALVAQNIRQAAQIAQQTAQIEAKNDQIQTLSDELSDLRARMSKDSHNSSKPPSTDGLQKKTKSLRKPSGKPSGGQKGHNGSTLTRTQNPTRTVVLPLPAVCDRCGTPLPQDAARPAEKRQVIDVPPIQPEVTEYQSQTLKCLRCGLIHTSLFPPAITQPIQYGPRVKAIGVLFTQWHNLPYLRNSQLMGSLFNVQVSQGSLCKWTQKAATLAQPQVEIIKANLALAPVVHADESGIRVAKKLQWLHVVATETATLYGIHAKRGMEAIKAHGLLPNYLGILVHDCFSPYWNLSCGHALCNAHLLRELVYIGDTTGQEWPQQMINFLNSSNTLRNAAALQGTPLTNEAIEALTRRYESILFVGEQLNPRKTAHDTKRKRGRIKQTDATNLLARLRDHAKAVLHFLRNPEIPFTNNTGEQAIRMPKGKQKVAGCFRSTQGGEYYFTIRSCLDTMRKQGHDAHETLSSLFQGGTMRAATG